MNRLIYLSLCLLSLLCGCTPPSERDMATGSITSRFKKQVKKNDELYLLGFGGGDYIDVKSFFFHFYSFKQIDIDSARQLLVNKMEQLREIIDSDVDIQPFLHTIPFDLKETELIIGFYRKNMIDFVDPPSIAHVSFFKGMVIYAQYNPFEGSLEHLLDETYQEAFDIVEQQKNVSNLSITLESSKRDRP